MKTYSAIISVFLISVSAALAVWNKAQVVVPRPVIAERMEKGTVGDRLRICSYNLEHFFDGIKDGATFTPEQARAHSKAVAGLLDRIDPDIAVFIEFENADMLRLLNADLKRPFPLGYVTAFQNRDGQPDPLNMALVSRVPLSSVREIRFHTIWDRKPPPRGIMAVTVELSPGRKLLIYAVHLKSNFGNKQSNRQRRKYVMQYVRQDAEQVVGLEPDVDWEILAVGDVNVDPDNPEFADDPSLHPVADWVDVWRGRPIEERTTVPTRYGDPALVFPPAAFDRFFISPALTRPPWSVSAPMVLKEGVNTNNVKTIPGFDGHISDHYPVYIDLMK